MSVAQECALVEKAIQRARSVVAPQASPPREVALGRIDVAAETTTTTPRMTDDSSGAFIDAYRNFATRDATVLRSAGWTEGELQTQVATAAELTRRGARRMDVIVGHTHATLRAGAAATSPAAQRVILRALRAQLCRATEVVDSISRRGAELAGRIEALDYESVSAPRYLGPPMPEGPIVWCLRPNGTFGSYRCSILYPDLRVSTYWSPTDDTHG